MTQEEKQLLLKDLCARLPYGVKVNFRSNIEVLCEVHIYQSVQTMVGERGILYDVDMPNVKPYLRPMSSMTEEERDEYRKALDKDFTILEDSLNSPISYKYADGTVVRDRVLFNEVDWLNKHHFDYRGLIEKCLAIEAPEGMYEK